MWENSRKAEKVREEESVYAERSREVLRLLERAAVEHLAWLMRVHAALMFPERPGGGAAPPAPSPANCGDVEELQGLDRARGLMHARATELLAASEAGYRPAPAAYRAFMAAVEAYAREARRAETHFRRVQMETDPLTGVANRLGMMRELRREWTRVLRTGRPACIALADLDLFKQVNDLYGHPAGDRVLCATAAFFRRRLRPYDLVFRYGGEGFLFCLPDSPLPTARRVLDRVRGLLARQAIELDGGTALQVTCSIGVAELGPGRSVPEAVEAADRALYVAKEAGRNRVAVAPPPPSSPRPLMAGGRARPLQGAVRP